MNSVQFRKLLAKIIHKLLRKKQWPYLVTALLLIIIGNLFWGLDYRQFIPKNDPSTNISLQNFQKAKTHLITLYQNNPQQHEFYCGCEFEWEGKKGVVNLSSCGYKVRKNSVRANRIEWEHVVPAHAFGHQLQCWQKGGRENCKKAPDYSEKFNLMEGDMHNLQPAVGEINADRSNFGFSEFTRDFNQYGQCQFAADFNRRIVQPRNEIKGVIGRTYLYMADRYQLHLSRQERRLMESWDKLQPPTKWECERNQYIAKIQGNDNPFITQKCP